MREASSCQDSWRLNTARDPIETSSVQLFRVMDSAEKFIELENGDSAVIPPSGRDGAKRPSELTTEFLDCPSTLIGT